MTWLVWLVSATFAIVFFLCLLCVLIIHAVRHIAIWHIYPLKRILYDTIIDTQLVWIDEFVFMVAIRKCIDFRNSRQGITMIKLQVYQYDAHILVAIFQVVPRGVKPDNPQILQRPPPNNPIHDSGHIWRMKPLDFLYVGMSEQICVIYQHILMYSGMQRFGHPWSKYLLLWIVKWIEDELITKSNKVKDETYVWTLFLS